MTPAGGVSGRAGPDDATAPDHGSPPATAPVSPASMNPPGGADRPTRLAEAAAWWELRDEIALHVLGLNRDDDLPESVHGFLQTVSDTLIRTDMTVLARAGSIPAARTPPADLPAGNRVERWRRRRGLTQHDLARRVGRPSRWIAAIERGIDHIPTIDSAREIAVALRIDTPLLTGRDPGPQALPADDPIGESLERVREFLERSDAMGPAPTTTAPPLAAIALILRNTWQLYDQAEYGNLMRALPRLLQAAAASDSTRAAGHDAPEAARLLSQVYQLTATALRKLGAYHLSWLTADRAIEAASRGHDRLLTAAAARFASAALLAMGRATPALALTRTAMACLPATTGADSTSLVVRGTLLLHGATAAARLGDATTTNELLSSADTAAARLGHPSVRYGARFGPVHVDLFRVSTAVELGEGERAIHLHTALRQSQLDALPREQHAGHHLTLARAYLQTGSVDQAAKALEASTRLAPAEARSPLHQAIRRQIRTV
jgi:transcriptional regulator with XRE-family HTH domain